MHIATTVSQLATEVSVARSEGKKVALVPTMGALHAGHLSLIAAARKHADFVVVSIFVNPLQFGAGEDFDKYPRTLDADVESLEVINTDVLFAPSVDDVYPEGSAAKPTKSAGGIGVVYEGAARPGHFDGMLTVVARLFDLVQPDFAVFGQKDAQQLFLIQQMAKADYPALQIVPAPTVREPGGLAMSSRNRYLDAAAHEVAEQLSAALRAGQANAASPSAALESARAFMSKAPEAKLDYIALVAANSFEPIDDEFKGRALLLIAAVVGQTRLIDNIEITF
ncbi:pantoate--beta-alanine ligase [Rhodoluna sp. KAS3]|uniref:pantoate--beta-alanine ligase n=1 Tax=Rhodoluna sp. KAS3 TaxID=942880 RepID=UPI00222FB50A|nr:pantoate--beta-alanine ligase [Rhodoluna sp. KAS3]BDS49603.1 pantothenate synthetase [Rhodoluna sp. KAS3]